MKNNKGFTLVELLAAIVILGVLMWFAIPQIMGLLSSSRDKMFVSDAKKLISQAEYKMKSQNSIIEKPADGNCIALSLVFLDNGDFNSTPNEGSYEKEASYVVVKNNLSSLEYSVNLIEKNKKGDYRGVVLTRANFLDNKRGAALVKNVNNLIEVESDDFTIDYVNDQLGTDYCDDIETVYNQSSYSGGGDGASNTEPPVISRVSLTSTSKKNYNTKDATLSLTVTDEDTAKSNLKVYLSNTSYDDARSKTPESYGDNETFLKEFVFDTSTLGNTIYLYIVVKDDTGNEVKKKLTYPIHTNDPPTILSTSYITKRDQDKYNMPTAKLVLNVNDDNDSREELSVCLIANGEATTCNGYQGFTSLFGDSNTIEYSFSNNSCYLNGDVKQLKVFVRDSSGQESSQVFDYAIYNNQVPSINNVSVTSQTESFTTTGSLRVRVNFDTSDDITDKPNLRVRLSDGSNTNDYAYQEAGYDYVFSGGYDGQTRTLTITVFDGCDKFATSTQSYTVYSNGAPTITNLSVNSKSNACSKVELCPLTAGGTYATDVSFNVTDDSDSDVLVCVSENAADCSNNSNYQYYSQAYSSSFTYNFTKNCSKDYSCDNQDRVLYVYAKDSSNTVSHLEMPYKIYKNDSPVMKNVSITPIQDGTIITGSKRVRIVINGEDDFSDNNAIKYKIQDDVNVIEGMLDESGMVDVDYTFSGTYNSEVKLLEISLEDSDGFGIARPYSYTLYENQPPTVNSFNIIGDDTGCGGTTVCPVEFNNYKVKFDLDIEDDIDYVDSTESGGTITYSTPLKVCITEDVNGCSSDSDYVSYLSYYNTLVPYTFTVDGTNPYVGDEKTIYLKAKDSAGLVSSNTYTYTIYTNVAPEVSSFNVYSTNKNYVNSTDIVVETDVSDDFGMINVNQKVCYTIGTDTTEHCLSDDYVSYQRKTYANLTGFEYNGTTLHFYAYYKDNYGLVTQSSTFDYQLYTDAAPVINEADSVVISGSNVVSVGVKVEDYLDTYQVGISETSGSGYTYTGSFSGDDLKNNVVTFTPSWNVANYITSLGSSTNYNKLYVVVKDSHNKISSEEEVEVKLYSSCSISDSGDSYYEYELDTTKTGNTAISASLCSGKCYYDNDDGATNIKAYYKEKISYKDKFGTSYCLKEQNDFEANCSFKDCFYNSTSSNYTNNVIGTSEIMSDYPWAFTLGTENYVCYSYFNLYTSSYTEGNAEVTLTPTNTKICAAAIDKYGYNPSNPANSYLFADDSMYID